MNCEHCGAMLNTGDTACSICGTPVSSTPAAQAVQEKVGMGILGALIGALIGGASIVLLSRLGYVAAISAGIVDNQPMLDLCYEEDSAAMVDLNCVMDDKGRLIEIQGTGEERPFTLAEQQQLVKMTDPELFHDFAQGRFSQPLNAETADTGKQIEKQHFRTFRIGTAQLRPAADQSGAAGRTFGYPR